LGFGVRGRWTFRCLAALSRWLAPQGANHIPVDWSQPPTPDKPNTPPALAGDDLSQGNGRVSGCLLELQIEERVGLDLLPN
jgi:hypothetical protein